MKTALSVNLNKVALVRNTRHLGIPSVTRAAQLCLAAGAQGITVHPRPDARHIRADDVHALHDLLQQWPDREFNIEGNPFHNLMDFVLALKPHQATFVPDGEGQFTSDHGWRFPEDAERLRPLIAQAKAAGVRVSLFMDPEPSQMAAARAVGADRVELYTEPYAQAHGTPQQAQVLAQYRDSAQAALDAGLPGHSQRHARSAVVPGGRRARHHRASTTGCATHSSGRCACAARLVAAMARSRVQH